jgi:predicted DNA-binding protein YlxM (UPF0122 family)
MKLKILDEFNIRGRIYNEKKLITDLEETLKYLKSVPNIGTWNNLRQKFTFARDISTINAIYEGIERAERKLERFLKRVKNAKN